MAKKFYFFMSENFFLVCFSFAHAMWLQRLKRATYELWIKKNLEFWLVESVPHLQFNSSCSLWVVEVKSVVCWLYWCSVTRSKLVVRFAFLRSVFSIVYLFTYRLGEKKKVVNWSSAEFCWFFHVGNCPRRKKNTAFVVWWTRTPRVWFGRSLEKVVRPFYPQSAPYRRSHGFETLRNFAKFVKKSMVRGRILCYRWNGHTARSLLQTIQPCW